MDVYTDVIQEIRIGRDRAMAQEMCGLAEASALGHVCRQAKAPSEASLSEDPRGGISVKVVTTSFSASRLRVAVFGIQTFLGEGERFLVLWPPRVPNLV